VLVLGIDPGSVCAGWGLVTSRGSKIRFEAGGILRPPTGDPLAARLRFLHDELTAITARYQPDAVAVESVFYARHARSALILGHARGVLVLAATCTDAPLYEYAPAQVKKAVTGSGRADKEQVRKMVSLLVGHRIVGPHDQSDALAVAICHVHSAGFHARQAEAETRLAEAEKRAQMKKRAFAARRARAARSAE
jgi:crossover junction endodeoxyribonuclease RuvC